MSTNVCNFRNRRELEMELHQELVDKLDRCLEITMMLERADIHIDYKNAGDAIYHAFIVVEDLPEHA